MTWCSASPPLPPTISRRRGERANQRRNAKLGRCQPIRESFPLGPVIEAVRGVGEGIGGLGPGCWSWDQVSGTVDGEQGTARSAKAPPFRWTARRCTLGGAHGTWELTADTSGSYGLWLDVGNDPVTLRECQPIAHTVRFPRAPP
jgi:hypothetical protein